MCGRIRSRNDLMKMWFTGWLLLIAMGCSVSNSATMTGVRDVNDQNLNTHNNNLPADNENSKTPNCTDPSENCMVSKKPAAHGQNSNAPDGGRSADAENLKKTVVKNEDSKPLDCNSPNGYSLVVVTDPDRDTEKTITTPKILNIVAGDETRVAIRIPTYSDANGFSLRSAEKTKEGFEITIEYGTRYYYQKQFDFICKEGDFYLYKVKVESFDKFDPASRENWDRKEIEIKPNLPVGKFSIFDYLAN
jgi:hypothetical protein